MPTTRRSPTPYRAVAAALAAAAALSGCWVDACEDWDDAHGTPFCQEQLSGIFSAPDDTWCRGEESVMHTCRGLGYTAECEGHWVRPEDARRLSCP